MGATQMPPDDRPSKQAAFEAFLREGFVSIHLDARRSGVIVPSEFSTSPHLVLQYGLNMPIPIPDLEVTDDGVSATLSFARQPQRTVIPWNAIYIVACEDGRGVLYKEDVPEEVSLVARPSGGQPESRTPQPQGPIVEGDTGEVKGGRASDNAGDEAAPKDARRFLRSVPLEEANDAEDAGEGDSESGEPTKKRRRRPTLKLVK